MASITSIGRSLTHKRVYEMFFLGRNFVHGVQWTLNLNK